MADHREMYHRLLRMPQRDWETVREFASQSAGNLPSPMWPRFRTPPTVSREHLDTIARARAPYIAARLVEAHHADGHGLGPQHVGRVLQGVKNVS